MAPENPRTDDAAGTGPDPAQAKELAAVEELYRSCREPALKEALRCGLSQHQAEDVVSEVFAKLCARVRAGERFSDRQLTCGYIVRAVRYRARNEATRGRSRQERLEERVDAVQELHGEKRQRLPGPVSDLDAGVRRLEEPHRIVARACLYQGWTSATVAAVLGVSTRTVAGWRADILRCLRSERAWPPWL